MPLSTGWPPTAPSTGFVAAGVTTIVWGTDGFAQGALLHYIVKSIRASQRTEEAKVENGTGLTSTEILLIDGYDYEFTVVDDSTVNPPVAGQIVSLVNPTVGNQTGTTLFEVINNSYNAARKQEGERVMLARAFTLFPTFTAISAPAVS